MVALPDLDLDLKNNLNEFAGRVGFSEDQTLSYLGYKLQLVSHMRGAFNLPLSGKFNSLAQSLGVEEDCVHEYRSGRDIVQRDPNIDSATVLSDAYERIRTCSKEFKAAVDAQDMGLEYPVLFAVAHVATSLKSHTGLSSQGTDMDAVLSFTEPAAP